MIWAEKGQIISLLCTIFFFVEKYRQFNFIYVHKKRETGESSYEFQIKCGGPRPSYVPLFRPYIWPAALERQKRGLEPSQPAGPPPPHLLPLVQARLQAEGYLRGVLQLQVRAAQDLVRRFQKWARVRLKIEMASFFFFFYKS